MRPRAEQAGGLAPGELQQINEQAELLADLLAATGLLTPDKLALAKGPSRRLRFARAGARRRGRRERRRHRAHARRALPAAADRPWDDQRQPRGVEARAPARARAQRCDPVRDRRQRPPCRRLRSGQRPRDRRAPSRDAADRRARRRVAGRCRGRGPPPRPPVGGIRCACRARRGSRGVRRGGGGRRRPRGRRRDLRCPARPARQLRHLPGRRGRRLGHPLGAAGGLARRPPASRRRAARGAADPEAPRRRCDDAPEGAREARHRRASKAAGRPHRPERRGRRTDDGHPCRSPADGRRRVDRHASRRQVEEGADARRARPLGRHAEEDDRDLHAPDRRTARDRADRLR